MEETQVPKNKKAALSQGGFFAEARLQCSTAWDHYA
jgi:hypothetical protein